MAISLLKTPRRVADDIDDAAVVPPVDLIGVVELTLVKLILSPILGRIMPLATLMDMTFNPVVGFCIAKIPA